MATIWSRLAIVAALVVSGLATAGVPSGATELPRLTITDGPGAPGDLLQQIERLAGQPLGDLQLAVAVDTGGRPLTTDQIGALLAGREVDGVQVLGAMSGSQEILDTTIADLSDGRYDGPRDEGVSTATVLFASSVAGGREWCLTMCLASLRPLRECILEHFGRIEWLNLDLAGGTTLDGMRGAAEQAGETSWGEVGSVQTLVGDAEMSEEDIRTLVEGGEAGSVRHVANVDSPDNDWRLDDVGDIPEVVYARTIIHVFHTMVPWFGDIQVVCVSRDGGKTWKCTWKEWHGF